MSKLGHQPTGLMAVFFQQLDVPSGLIVISNEHPEHWHSVINLIKQTINVADNLVALRIVCSFSTDIVLKLGFGEYADHFVLQEYLDFRITFDWSGIVASPYLDLVV
jgi:hypothetical protein